MKHGGMVGRMNNTSLPMPVKVKPYAHQRKAFDFVMRIFHSGDEKQSDREDGERDEAGQRKVRLVRKTLHQARD